MRAFRLLSMHRLSTLTTPHDDPYSIGFKTEATDLEHRSRNNHNCCIRKSAFPERCSDRLEATDPL